MILLTGFLGYTIFLAWSFNYAVGFQPIEIRELFFSEDGSITFGIITMESVEGTFEFSATGYLIEEPEHEKEIQIIGEFNAIPGEVPIMTDF